MSACVCVLSVCSDISVSVCLLSVCSDISVSVCVLSVCSDISVSVCTERVWCFRLFESVARSCMQPKQQTTTPQMLREPTEVHEIH